MGGRTNVSERPTISVNRRGGPPIQFIIQAKNFQKLEEKIPEFMAEAEKDPTFSFTDVNLKFNKPEIYVTIDREKAESLGGFGTGCGPNPAIVAQWSTFWLFFDERKTIPGDWAVRQTGSERTNRPYFQFL